MTTHHFGTNVYCLPTKYESLFCYKVCILLLNQVFCMSVFPLVNMHIPIVLCCGAKRVLFTNKYWCHIIKPYLFTKFHTSKHLGKRVTLTCMFTLFFVLFTNKLSKCRCRIINPNIFTKFHTSKHLGKRVTQICTFTLFYVVV